MPGKGVPDHIEEGGRAASADYGSGAAPTPKRDGSRASASSMSLGSGEEAECDGGGCLSTECVAMATCIITIIGVGALILSFGPMKALRYVLQCIPKRPGWDWYIGLGLMTMVSIVMILPIWPPMCMAAGLIFGLFPGAVMNFFSIVGAAIISLTIGRFVLKKPIRRWVADGDYPRARKIMHVLEDSEHSLKFQVLFRFLFLPMFIRNYGPSTLHIPLWKLALATIPHSIWISFLFSSLGATFTDAAELVRDGKQASFKDMKWQQLAIFCVSFCVAISLAVFAHRKYTEYLENEQADLAAQKKQEEEEQQQQPRASQQA